MDLVIKNLNNLYNAFFYASLCHVCKQSSGNIALKQCSGCRMIVYCSQKHQKEHWPEHKDLCKAIQHVRESFRIELSVYQGTSILMKFLMVKVEQKLERGLQIYEVEMFKYARICSKCYKTGAELEGCPHCMTVWFCAQHKNYHDKNTCEHLKVCLESTVSFLQEPARPNLTNAYIRVPSYEKEFSNMQEFISIYGDIKGIQSETSSCSFAIKQSVRLTRPLTVLYGLRVLEYIPIYEKNKTELVLHVIAATDYELHTLTEWEILLHIFPNLLRLKLVLIGPLDKFMEKRNVCDICVQKKKSFSVEWQNISYSQYVYKYPTFKEPDLVITFYNEQNDNYSQTLHDTWISSLKCISKHNCPLLLCHPQENNTADTVINTELCKTIEFCTYKNPFASLYPNRTYDEDIGYSVYYENAYLTVYKTLCP